MYKWCKYFAQKCYCSKIILNCWCFLPAHRRPTEENPSASVWGEQAEWMGGDSEAPAAGQQQTCESHISALWISRHAVSNLLWVLGTRSCKAACIIVWPQCVCVCVCFIVRESAHLPHGWLLSLGGAKARQQHNGAADHGRHASLTWHTAVLHHLDLLWEPP